MYRFACIKFLWRRVFVCVRPSVGIAQRYVVSVVSTPGMCISLRRFSVLFCLFGLFLSYIRCVRAIHAGLRVLSLLCHTLLTARDVSRSAQYFCSRYTNALCCGLHSMFLFFPFVCITHNVQKRDMC